MVELLSYVLSPMSTTTTTTTTTTTGRRSTRQSSGRSRRDAQSLSHDGTEERGLGQQLPGQFPRSRSLPRTSSAPTSTGTTRAVIEITNIIEDEDIEMTDANLETEQQDGEEQQQEQQIQLPPIQAAQSLASEVDGSFNPFGNLGDYVFSQSALDNIITQLMDAETRRDGPVAASDEVIESIPRHTLTQDELDAKTECSVCKDEFAKDDQCLQLKCKHIFHNDCIKPWLKTSGTCPTCRYAVVPQERPQDNEEESDDDDEEDDDDNNLRTPYHRRLASYSTRDRYGSSAATGAGSSLPGSFPTL
ncbi:hypothetical protein B0O80DRAFT_420865 [Mortierella sp. GBAus27b]|nr:hypothetical protein B0O80DRAFT_420865 [Mortierella sp. GBAus27b]